MKSLLDVANAILMGRPSPSRMRRLLSNIFVPRGLENFVEKGQALCDIEAACNDVERWLTSELPVASNCETQSQDGFEQLEYSELGSEFEDFDDGVLSSQTGEGTPGRSQTM
jgi:hypothetical protein